MCGIAGGKKAEEINSHQSHRGETQSKKQLPEKNYSLAHTLHSIVGCVEQPLENKNTLLVANCEIYNWKELEKKHELNCKNDAELLHQLLDKNGLSCLEEVEGVYAFAYYRNNKIYLARDKLGVKPLWYTGDAETLHFASERQALEKEGFNSTELHPRRLIVYDLEENKVDFENRDFFQINVREDSELNQIAEEVKNQFLEAVEKRIPKDKEIGLLFSGGVDSTMVAAALKELDKEFTCYTAGIQHGNVNSPRDLEWAKEIAEELELELEVYNSDLEEVERTIPKLTEWLSTTNTVKIGVALPFHLALQGDEKVVFTGLGSEQLYAGYYRQQGYLNKECLSDLRSIYHRDLYRDDVVAMRNGYELRIPFLDHQLVKHALEIPEKFKRNEEHRKYVLRLAAEKLGVPEKVVWRKKVAAQYGSNFDKALSKITNNKGFSHKQEYLNSLRASPNNRLAGLTSGGKDSCAAIYRMHRRNNDIRCLLNIRSDNKDSYMFDVEKEQDTLEKQSNDIGKPLLTTKTKGEKEEELKDLRNLVEKAMEMYSVEGLVAGALASTYQRDRVDKIAEQTGLKVFTPLWRDNQPNYMRWLIREGFKIEITDVAARGLKETWVGTILDGENVEKLIELSEENGFNAAGEGGEYETLVIEMPPLD